MYMYSPPFAIIKENSYYRVLDQLGGKYKLDAKTLLTALSVMGKELRSGLLDTLKVDLGVIDVSKRLSSLIESGFITTSKHKRKDSFNYKKVIERIINNDGKEKDILNIGSITLASIKHCPYNCEGCYAHYTFEEKKPEVGLGRLKQTIEDAITMGANHLTLSGGEVTISQRNAEKTAELSRFASSKGMTSITIVTTGYQLDKFIDLFSNAGVTDFQISVDGFKDYNDDYKKRDGATERSFKAIKVCQNKKVNYTTNTVVSKKNIDSIAEFVAELVNKGVPNIRLSKIITNKHGLKIDPNSGRLLEEIVNGVKDRFHVNINGPFGNPYIVDDYINCVAGKLYAHIDYSGSVLPCAFMNDRVVGNINQQRLIEIWSLNNPILKDLSEGFEISSKCNNCGERYYCFGNCIRDYELKESNCKNG